MPDVLSATYDIKVVFLPQSLSTDRTAAAAVLPNKIVCNLTTVDANGKQVTEKTDALYTNPEVVDTVTILSGYHFETCNYEEESVTTKLKIQSQVLSKERDEFSRTLLIDCVIFEPSKE